MVVRNNRYSIISVKKLEISVSSFFYAVAVVTTMPDVTQRYPDVVIVI